MSPTSYQTAPPRVGGMATIACPRGHANLALARWSRRRRRRCRSARGRRSAQDRVGGLDLGLGLVDLVLVRADVAVAQGVVGLAEQVDRLVQQPRGLLGRGAAVGLVARADVLARLRRQ